MVDPVPRQPLKFLACAQGGLKLIIDQRRRWTDLPSAQHCPGVPKEGARGGTRPAPPACLGPPPQRTSLGEHPWEAKAALSLPGLPWASAAWYSHQCYCLRSHRLNHHRSIQNVMMENISILGFAAYCALLVATFMKPASSHIRKDCAKVAQMEKIILLTEMVLTSA